MSMEFIRQRYGVPAKRGGRVLIHDARVGRLRGYGNAIVAPQAAAFIEAVRDYLEGEQ